MKNIDKFKKFWVLEINGYICDADYNGKDLKERNRFPPFRRFWYIKSNEELNGFTQRKEIDNINLVNELLNKKHER